MAMVNMLSKALRTVAKSAAILSVSAMAFTTAASAQQNGTQQFGNAQGVATAIQGAATGNTRTVLGERYIPNIWVDPDGCEHWVMDDGVEGYLSARLDKYGKPVCSGAAPANVATGNFKGGATNIIGDIL